MRTVYELPTGRLIYTDTDNSAVYDLTALPSGSGMRVLVCGPRRTTPAGPQHPGARPGPLCVRMAGVACAG